jgi:hypothetical protein
VLVRAGFADLPGADHGWSNLVVAFAPDVYRRTTALLSSTDKVISSLTFLVVRLQPDYIEM